MAHCFRSLIGFICRYYLVSQAQTYIYPAPHIDVTTQLGGVRIDGSGFTPGSSIRIEVLDLSLHPLSTLYTTALSSGIGAGTFFTEDSTPCGPVYIAVDGVPGPTAWARVQTC